MLVWVWWSRSSGNDERGHDACGEHEGSVRHRVGECVEYEEEEGEPDCPCGALSAFKDSSLCFLSDEEEHGGDKCAVGGGEPEDSCGSEEDCPPAVRDCDVYTEFVFDSPSSPATPAKDRALHGFFCDNGVVFESGAE